MRGIGLCCAAFGLAGCSLLFASNLDAEGDAPASDAATAAETSAASDAPITPPVDASASDGDASVDASPDGSTRFCSTITPTPKFCADFDDPGMKVEDGWSRVFMSPQNVGAVELTDVARDGKAMSVKMNGAPACSYTRIEKEFPTTGKDMHVSFSMRPTTPWTTDAIYAVVRFLEASTIKCQIFLHLGQNQNVPASGDIHFQYPPGPIDDVFNTNAYPKGDVWSKIDLTIRAAGSVLLTVDGQIATDRLFPNGCSFGDAAMVGFGYHCENASPEIRFDDVVVDYP